MKASATRDVYTTTIKKNARDAVSDVEKSRYGIGSAVNRSSGDIYIFFFCARDELLTALSRPHYAMLNFTGVYFN